jgi:hypothetical protein
MIASRPKLTPSFFPISEGAYGAHTTIVARTPFGGSKCKIYSKSWLRGAFPWARIEIESQISKQSPHANAGTSVAKEKRLPRVAVCAFCKVRETQLYERDIPICVECADIRSQRKEAVTDPLIRTRLLQDVLEWTARVREAQNELEAVKMEASSFPNSDGTQHVKNASRKLATAGDEYAKAHTRLARYFASGIEPDDL